MNEPFPLSSAFQSCIPPNSLEVPNNSPRNVLMQANAIAGQDRSRDYGHPYENHRRIAEVWNMQIGKKLHAPITPREVALMMVGLKLAREANTPKYDNLVDAAGYIKCVEMIDQWMANNSSR